jgi:hypothetical protein
MAEGGIGGIKPDMTFRGQQRYEDAVSDLEVREWKRAKVLEMRLFKERLLGGPSSVFGFTKSAKPVQAQVAKPVKAKAAKPVKAKAAKPVKAKAAKPLKNCENGKIRNPKSNRCVNLTGAIGKKIIQMDKAGNPDDTNKTTKQATKPVKHCEKGKIFNPKSGRCVVVTSTIGKALQHQVKQRWKVSVKKIGE